MSRAAWGHVWPSGSSAASRAARPWPVEWLVDGRVMRALLLLGLPNALFSAAMVQHSTSLGLALVYLVGAPLAVWAALGVFLAASSGPGRLASAGVGRMADDAFGGPADGAGPVAAGADGRGRDGSPWVGRAVLVGLLVVAALVFAVVYPIADARKAVGAGTDADDALDLAVRSLLHGEYLYAQRTYLNNPITPLPGWIGLAVPFVVVFGRAAYLNVFWLGVWLAVLVAHTRSAWLAAWLAGLTFVVFPGVSITYLNGSDSFASVVAIGALLLALERLPRGAPRRTEHTPPGSAQPQRVGSLELYWGWLVALGAATGVVLSSRFNVVLLLPVLAAVVGRRAGRPGGLVYGGVAAGVWLVVSFAPWLVDPVAFTPLHTYGMLGRFDASLPAFGILVPLATGVLALALAYRVLGGADPWLAMAVVLSVPVVAGFLAEVVVFRHLDLWPLVYGLMATPLWVGAAVPAIVDLLGTERPQPPFWRLAARSASASRSWR